jgi:glycine/D-amino acid oxidase-like deaminating enzyme
VRDSHDVVIVGAGQAGLSLSYELTRSGRDHVFRPTSRCLSFVASAVSGMARRSLGQAAQASTPRDATNS